MFFYDENNPYRLWVHLHGFASNVWGSKIETLRNIFRERKNYSFFAMDMDYEKHTTSEILNVLEALITGFSRKFGEITLCGSSHGGYVAVNYLRFKEIGNIKRVVLFAPSFETLALIVKELGRERVKDWLEGKEKLVFKEQDREIEVREDFATDIIKNRYEIIEGEKVNFPEKPPVDIIIVHGTKDEIVPVERSRLFTSKVKVKEYIEVEDDHQLSQSFGRIVNELLEKNLI